MGQRPKRCLQSYLQRVVVSFQGWEHGSSKNEVRCISCFFSQPSCYKKITVQHVQKTRKKERNTKTCEKVATFRVTINIMIMIIILTIIVYNNSNMMKIHKYA